MSTAPALPTGRQLSRIINDLLYPGIDILAILNEHELNINTLAAIVEGDDAQRAIHAIEVVAAFRARAWAALNTDRAAHALEGIVNDERASPEIARRAATTLLRLEPRQPEPRPAPHEPAPSHTPPASTPPSPSKTPRPTRRDTSTSPHLHAGDAPRDTSHVSATDAWDPPSFRRLPDPPIFTPSFGWPRQRDGPTIANPPINKALHSGNPPTG